MKRVLIVILILAIIVVAIWLWYSRRFAQMPSVPSPKEAAQKEAPTDITSVKNLDKDIANEIGSLNVDTADLDSLNKDTSLDSLDKDLSNISF